LGHTSFQLNRRAFLRAGLSTAGAMALGPAFLERAFAAQLTVGAGPYGPLKAFDSNGIALPEGFSSREIARGASVVPGSVPPYVWHNATDGQATFPTLSNGVPDGGWILTANSEMPIPTTGGVSGVEFAADGRVERAYRVLSGTTSNCAGGPAPWGKWLSCEEHDLGMVHECDPTTLNLNPASARPALGVFAHEAVCVDPVGERLYLTEDKSDGCFYRFTPDDYPDLSSGLLELAVGPVDTTGKAQPGQISWVEVPNPQGGALQPTRRQVGAAAHFDGGEGTWFDEGIVYFTTKGDGRVWTYDVAASRLDILYDKDAVGPDAPLDGVDNITVSPSGDIFVCEDGRDHDICMITPEAEVMRFLKLDPVKHAGPTEPNPLVGNETVGVVFSPDGSRMYFGAQRSFGVAGVRELPAGVVYEISGPFRQAPTDRARPRLRVRVKRRFSLAKFLARGLPVRMELDDFAGVKLTLKQPGGDGRKAVTLATAAPSVAVRDRMTLRLKPTEKARRMMRKSGDEEFVTRLKVVATDGAGNQTVVRRKVVLASGDGKEGR
jgi:uncharacterized protein